MNKIVILLSVLSVACAAMNLRTAPAVEYIENRDDLGQYAFRYYTAEGTLVEQRGHLIDTKDGARVLVIEGTVTYTAPDGKTYITKYTSGPDGYHAYGDHIPVEKTESE